jgi:hypothetical protein
MKLRSGGIDDLHNELLFLLDQAAEKWWARPLRALVNSTYRRHHRRYLLLISIAARLAVHA